MAHGFFKTKPLSERDRENIDRAFEYLSEAVRLIQRSDAVLTRVDGQAEQRERMRGLAMALAEERDALWSLYTKDQ
jgi:hypothetical protein